LLGVVGGNNIAGTVSGTAGKTVETMQKHLQEAVSGTEGKRRPMADRMELEGAADYLLTQMAEKDMLLC
jgi:hypothetical protein